MKISYIILAHNYPFQVKRLVSRLHSVEVYFYIHIDKTKDTTPFKLALNEFENVYFMKDEERQVGVWGGFGIVQGTITALRRVISENNDGYCVLLSGQDYPIAPNSKIKRFFRENHGSDYITTFQLPHPGWKDGGMSRLTNYRFSISNERGHYVLLPPVWKKSFYSKRTVKQIFTLVRHRKYSFLKEILFKRKVSKTIKPYGGSQWWAISTQTLSKMIGYIDNNAHFAKSHKHTLLADEIFFQTIIHHIALLDSSVNIKRSITYVDWERKNVPLPVTFTQSDFMELAEASKKHLFARKFDQTKHESILNLIDDRLLNI